MFSERILFFGKADYSYMRKKNENVALTLEEQNIECANEWKMFGTIRNAHFSRRYSPERWMGQSRDEKYDVFVYLNRYNGISNVEYAQMFFENEK